MRKAPNVGLCEKKKQLLCEKKNQLFSMRWLYREGLRIAINVVMFTFKLRLKSLLPLDIISLKI